MGRPKLSEAEQVLAAEVRAVEEGHRAFFVGSIRNGMAVIRVVSDTEPNKHYHVTGHLEGTLAVFECYSPTHPDFKHGSGKPVPCKHAALAARRLEREGLLKWSEGWWASDKLLRMLKDQFAADTSAPFEGLPS